MEVDVGLPKAILSASIGRFGASKTRLSASIILGRGCLDIDLAVSFLARRRRPCTLKPHPAGGEAGVSHLHTQN